MAIVGDRGLSISSVFEHNTRRGVASVFPWRAHKGRANRDLEDTKTHGRHGVVRCKYCGGPTTFVAFTKSAGGNRGPRLEVACELQLRPGGPKPPDDPKPPGCEDRQTIACEKHWRMLIPMWRTSPVYLALRSSQSRYERVHHHWRNRYRVASDDHTLRPKRRGVENQQLRANAALLLEWFLICDRENWMPGSRNTPLNPDRIVVDDGRKADSQLWTLRHELGLDHPYGDVAVAAGTGKKEPTPGARTHKPLKLKDPSEPEDPVTIPATMTTEEFEATEYGQALAAASSEEGVDTSRDLGDLPEGLDDPDPLPPESYLE